MTEEISTTEKAKLIAKAVVGEFLNPENWIKGLVTYATFKGAETISNKAADSLANRKNKSVEPPVKARKIG